jgi:hypothetical protein
VFIGHNDTSERMDWQFWASSGLFGGSLQGDRWDYRIIDWSCFGERRPGTAEWTYHSSGDGWLPYDERLEAGDVIRKLLAGDIKGGMRLWAQKMPTRALVGGRWREPVSTLRPPRRTRPP